MKKLMMTAAFVLAATTAPVMAQTDSQTGSTSSTGSTGSGGMQSGSMQQDGMSNSSMNASSSKMSKSHMAAMKRCQSSAKAMKTKSCMKMQQMHPEMNGSTNM